MRDYVRLGGILFIITASVALVLSIGNHATKARQKALTDESANKARLEVISSAEDVLEDTAETMEYSKEGSSVKSVTSYKNRTAATFMLFSALRRVTAARFQ